MIRSPCSVNFMFSLTALVLKHPFEISLVVAQDFHMRSFFWFEILLDSP